MPKILSGYADTSEASFYIESNGQRTDYGTISGRQLSSEDYKKLNDHLGTVITLRDSSMRKYAKSFQINGQKYIIFVQKDIGKKEMVFVPMAILHFLILLQNLE